MFYWLGLVLVLTSWVGGIVLLSKWRDKDFATISKHAASSPYWPQCISSEASTHIEKARKAGRFRQDKNYRPLMIVWVWLGCGKLAG